LIFGRRVSRGSGWSYGCVGLGELGIDDVMIGRIFFVLGEKGTENGRRGFVQSYLWMSMGSRKPVV